MFNLNLNKLKLTSTNIYDYFIIDKKSNVTFSKSDHFKIIENYIEKYCIDNNYNDKAKISALIKNIKNLFDKLSFNAIFTNINENEYTNNPLKYYELKISKKSFTFMLLFNSFLSKIIINVTFIYGVDDQVIVNCERIISLDEEHQNDKDVYDMLDMNKRSLSNRGIYYSLLSPLYQNYNFIKNGIHILIMKSMLDKIIEKNNIDKIDSMKYTEIIEKMFSFCKYYYLNKDARDKYKNNDGSINYELLNSGGIAMLNVDQYSYNALFFINELFNEKITDIDKFTTMENTMIDIDELYSLIPEIVIDTILVESFDIKRYIDDVNGENNYYSDDINQKLITLMSKYLYYYIEFVNNVLNINLLNNNIKNNPLLQYKSFLANEFIDAINIQSKINIDNYDSFLFMSTKEEEINNYYDTLAKEQNCKKEDIPEYVDYINILNTAKKMNTLLINEFGINYKILNSNLFTNIIFHREEINRETFANIDRLFNISFNIRNISPQINYSLDETEIKNNYQKISSELRSKYNIECTIENLKKIYNEYVDPIIDSINDSDDNINMINKSFSEMNINTIFEGNSNINNDDFDNE